MKKPLSTLLLTTDRSRSILTEITPGTVNRVSYSPYGSQRGPKQARQGFNGELREPSYGWYHLGNGHRVYSPVLRRFHSPDRLSPFAEGGLNPYAYCVGDPINYTDPTGAAPQFLHIAALVGFGIALLAGGVSLAGPLLLKGMAAKTSSFVAHAVHSASSRMLPMSMSQSFGTAAVKYAASQPGLGTTVLGGLDFASSVLSLAGVPVGVAGTIESMQEDPARISGGIMWAGAMMSLFAVPVKSLVVPLTPKLLTSKAGQRFARFVHGPRKVTSAHKDALNALRVKDYDEFLKSGGGVAGGGANLVPPARGVKFQARRELHPNAVISAENRNIRSVEIDELF